MKIKITPYKAPLWLENGFLNTYFGAKHIFEYPRPEGQNVEIPFTEGGKTTGLWIQGTTDWVIIGSHGLGGDLDSDFCKRMPFLARQYGHSVLVVNHRNAGSALGLSDTPYNSGRGQDMSDYIAFARKRAPKAKILAFAYSLGGSMLLNLITGRSGTELPDMAVVINPPLDLYESSKRLSRGRAFVFGQSFVKDLRATSDELIRKQIINERFRIPKIANLRTVDEVFTAPLSGYRNAKHYYQEASAGPHLDKIKVPTILVAALDDPMIDFSPLKTMVFPKHVQLHLEKYGGHLGFAMGTLKDAKMNRLEKWTSILIRDILSQI